MRKSLIALSATLLTAAAVTPMASASAQDAPAVKPVVATFDVHGEKFKVKFTNPADIKTARDVLAGKADPLPIPSGKIVYGSADVNTGYSWHLDPVGWTEVAMEVCDGRPRSDVESHQLTSPYYCPWGAKLISLN